MVGLPRAIIKRYGVSKKAWAVYRGTKTHSRKRYRVKTRGITMGRKSRHRRYYSQGGSMLGPSKIAGISTKGIIAGGALLSVAGAFFAPMLNAKLPQYVPYQDIAIAGAIGGPFGALVRVGLGAIPMLTNGFSSNAGTSAGSGLLF